MASNNLQNDYNDDDEQYDNQNYNENQNDGEEYDDDHQQGNDNDNYDDDDGDGEGDCGGNNAGDDDDNQGESGGDGGNNSISGDSPKYIRLRGLPWSATHQEILDFLENVKVINGSQGIYLVTSRWDGKNTGEAYVEVASQEDVEEARKLNKASMGHRYIEVFTATPKEAKEAMRKTAGPGTAYVVKLRGLPYAVTEQQIEEFFNGLEIKTDREGILFVMDRRGRATGEAFVQFESQDDTEQALGRNREKIGHRYIEIFRSSLAEMKRAMNGNGRPGPYDIRDRGSNRGGGNDFGGRNDWGNNGGGNGGGGGGGSGFGVGANNMLGFNNLPSLMNSGNFGNGGGPNFGNGGGGGNFGNGGGPNFGNGGGPNFGNNGGGGNNCNFGNFGNGGGGNNGGGGFGNNRFGNNGNSGNFGNDFGDFNNFGNDRNNFGNFGNNNGGGGGGGGNFGNGGGPNFGNGGGNFGGGNNGNFGGGNNGNFGNNGFNNGGGNNFGGGGNFGPIGGGRGNDVEYFTIHMRGLPYTSFENDVFKFFDPVRPANVRINYNKKGLHSGTADAYFDTNEDAQLAMKRHREKIGSRYIELFYDGKTRGGHNLANMGNVDVNARFLGDGMAVGGGGNGNGGAGGGGFGRRL